MSEMWTDDGTYEPVADATADYGSDYGAEFADPYVGDLAEATTLGVAEPAAPPLWQDPTLAWSADPWVEPPMCCGCDDAGWAEQVVAAVPAEPQGLSSVVMAETLPAETWGSWDQVAADPGAAAVTVGGSIDTYPTDYSVMAADGSVVDPAQVYPSVFTVGGQSLEPQFTVIQPPLEAAPPTGTMVIGGNTFGDVTITDPQGNVVNPGDLLGGSMVIGGNTYGDITITDPQGNVVNPGDLLGGSMVIGGPSAGIGVGSNPMGAFMTLYETAAQQGNRMAMAAAQTMMNTYRHGIDIWLAPEGTRWETRYEPLI